MKQYFLIKADFKLYSNIEDALRMILGNHILLENRGDYLWLETNHNSIEEMEAIFQSLESDLNTLICYYTTDSERFEKEISLVLFPFLKVAYGHYNLKSFIPQIKNEKLAREIFHFIVDGTGVEEQIILSMAESDLNVSQASSKLFMHRNTLLYKIERLEELRGFDLKKFYDLYLLMYLLKV